MVEAIASAIREVARGKKRELLVFCLWAESWFIRKGSFRELRLYVLTLVIKS